MENKIYAENFEEQRLEHEKFKYGRLPNPEIASHAHVYVKHSIEPSYGHYDRPINESV